MAKLKPGFMVTGPIGNLSIYEMRGVDEPVVRRKGGASKEDIKTLPAFKRTREINLEFGGRALVSKWVMQMLFPQKQLAGYNIAGSLNSILRSAQALDTDSKSGQRHVRLSGKPQILAGFSLNKKNTFDSTVRNPLSWRINRETLSAGVDIPALEPGINLITPPGQHWFSFVFSLGLVPDAIYNGSDRYEVSNPDFISLGSKWMYSDWFPTAKGSPALSFDLQHPNRPSDESFSMMFSIGIRYGAMTDTDTIQQASRVGAAKILAMA